MILARFALVLALLPIAAAATLPAPSRLPDAVRANASSKQLLDKAYAGDVEAIFQVGSRIYEGRDGFPKDWDLAREWLLEAAEKDHHGAQFAVAAIYLFGRGVTADPRAAFRWYERLALSGDPGGQFALAMAYSKGIGVAIDWTKAAEWLAKAAQQGRPLAQLRLGELYEAGRGVPKDEEKARALYEQALAGGETKAGWYLGLLYRDGRGGVNKDLVKAYRLVSPVRILFEEGEAVVAELRAQMNERELSEALKSPN